MADAAALPLESATVRRWNSMATSVVVSNKLNIPATPPNSTTSVQASPNQNQNTETPSSSLLNVELVSPFSSYTSLKDVLPCTNASINSPTASSVALINSGYEISIRNRLVKQAAWAYLQPMSASPSTSSGPDFLRRLWQRFSSVTACLSFIYHQLVRGFARVLHRILHAIRGHVST